MLAIRITGDRQPRRMVDEARQRVHRVPRYAGDRGVDEVRGGMRHRDEPQDILRAEVLLNRSHEALLFLSDTIFEDRREVVGKN